MILYIKYHAIAALSKIVTEAAISKIQNTLHIHQSSWSDDDWIQGLGIVGESAMVEHLIYLLYFADEYTYKSSQNPDIDLEEVSRLCCEAIAGLEKLGSERAI